MRFNSRHRTAGFSLVELVTVLAVGLIMTAVAVPGAMRQYRQYRLNSSTVSVANLLQRCRYEAIRLNTNVSCLGNAAPAGFTFWADSNNNGAVDLGEPQYLFPNDLVLGPAGAPGAAPTANFPGGVTPAPGVGGGITFTPRGGIVPPVGGGGGFFFSIGYPAAMGINTFRGVTVSPTGKTKIWGATPGSNWVWAQ